MAESLPPELIRACLAALSEPSDLLAAARVSKAFEREASSDELWHALYWRKWPAWTLIAPADAAQNRKELYRRRVKQKLRLTVSNAVHVLTGSTTDAYDGNETPLEATLCVAPPGRLSSALQLTGKLLGQVSFGAGSLHNVPVVKSWLGKELTAPGTGPVCVEWREHSSMLGHWVYQGTVSSDGREIRGSFHLSILPRKRGHFQMHAVDPVSHVGRVFGMRATHNQLAKRVAVKWASGALERAAAQHELLGWAV